MDLRKDTILHCIRVQDVFRYLSLMLIGFTGLFIYDIYTLGFELETISFGVLVIVLLMNL